MLGIYLMLSVSLPVLFCIILCFVVCCILFLKGGGPFRLLFFYSIAVAVAIGLKVYHTPGFSGVGEAGIFNFFIIPEFIVLVHYIRKQVISDSASRMLLFLHQAFPVIATYILLYSDTPAENKPILTGAHYFILCVVGLVFYYNMLIHPPTVSFMRFPPFWIATGIISCCLFSLTTTMVMVNGVAASLLARTGSYTLLFFCFLIAITHQVKLK